MKRFFDIILSFICLVLLIPVFLIIGLILLVYINDSIIFIQKRPGLYGEPFKFYKFRTMSQDRNKNGELLPDQNRLTKLGQLLRKTSLDELPSLWNVLIGDMSLVGPRPLLMEYLNYYTPEQARRHEIKPGITGWAQINGRNAIPWEKKFELDVWYVENQSFWLDLKIFWCTIFVVLKTSNISPPNLLIMERFDTYMKKNNE